MKSLSEAVRLQVTSDTCVEIVTTVGQNEAKWCWEQTEPDETLRLLVASFWCKDGSCCSWGSALLLPELCLGLLRSPGSSTACHLSLVTSVSLWLEQECTLLTYTLQDYTVSALPSSSLSGNTIAFTYSGLITWPQKKSSARCHKYTTAIMTLVTYLVVLQWLIIEFSFVF